MSWPAHKFPGCERFPARDAERRPPLEQPRRATASDVPGVPGTRNVNAVMLDGRLVGLAVWSERDAAFHAVNSSNDRLPGSFESEDDAADAVLDAREIERLEDPERFEQD